jgi:membrane-anchored mycosin MYCP
MANSIYVPIVEAAPQDAHGVTEPVAAATVEKWRALGHVHKETVGKDVRIGVVDTPVGQNSWFAGQVQGQPGVGNVPGLLAENYKAGHATFIAGLVLQQAPAAKVQVLGVLDRDGKGSTDDVVDAALRLAGGGQPVDILNLSLGSYGPVAEEATFRRLLHDLWATNANLVVVAAAGNKRNGENGNFQPACLADHTQLVSVGAATDGSATTLAPWGNTGPWLTFLANGTDLVSTYLRFRTQVGNPNGRWARWQGSSFATALASGIIAAAMSPGDGTRRTGPEAVSFLLGDKPRPVPLPTKAFPPAP